MDFVEEVNSKGEEYVIDELFKKKGNRNIPIREELIALLENKKEFITEMYESFNEKQSEERLYEMKRHFPEISEKRTEPIRINDFEPSLTRAVICSLYIENNIDTYYDELREKIELLEEYLNGDGSEEGKNIYLEMVRGRRISDEEASDLIRESIDYIDVELQDYEEEAEAFNERDIEKFGLTTNAAVKCLEDFEGRTFPFIRSVISNVEENDKVLEVGAGTGILSITAAIAGGETVIGIELNPITYLLANIIIDDLYRKGLLDRRESVNIVWSDALKFGYVEYTQYGDFTFDTIISENIYTGMFYELQMEMISRIIENKLVNIERDIINGFTHRIADANVVPQGMASAAELVNLGDYEPNGQHTEVLLDINSKGGEINKQLTDAYPYDILEYNIEEPPSIMAKIRYTAKENGVIDAINIYSVIKLSSGDYIARNENTFLNNDQIIHLNNSIQVEKGDEIIGTIAFNESDPIIDGIFEVRKVENGIIPEEYDARLNISERKHEVNKLNYKEKNNIKQELNLHELGDMEQLRCSSYYHDYEHTWRTNLRF